MIHNLKIEPKYLERVLTGEKTFEIRNNDRDFQKGDSLCFYIKNTENIPIEYKCINGYMHDIMPCFKIEYIHSGLGLDPNYVVLGLRQLNPDEPSSIWMFSFSRNCFNSSSSSKRKKRLSL